ncbi:purine-cytosine permease family protein [Leptothrix discophora]|uniref:Cytosine permease n=1 Tax=Leptothrix discophora TaxID=89 RepID=A0ABT9G1P7_LEPDI|nr:cytosine permease [Leptothrix discophora]MDP4300387.1 cytosine permease [Leptothrix discophora]
MADIQHDSSSSSSSTAGSLPRVFGLRDHAALWFSLGVGLLVMQVGAYLVPAMGTQAALLAIVVGSIVGAGLLAWTAQIACERGLSSAGLMSITLGRNFARLPVVLNIVQLLGWTAFELVVMRDGSAAIVKQISGFEAAWVPYAATLLWGGVLLALARGSMLTLVRRFIGRFGLPLVIASLLWLSWQFIGLAQTQGFEAFWNRPGSGGMSTIAAVDLVMAMPVSWLPLVADYARHGKAGSSTRRGTWLGYALANTWCYGLGVLVVSVAQPGADLVTTLLLAQGGLIALGLILVDEMDNAYGDVHSGAVSLNFLSPRRSLAGWGMVMALASTAAAMVLPMHSLEPFLLMLSSIFVPLFGVVISQLSGQTRGHDAAIAWGPALVWLVGIATFHLSPMAFPDLGSAIPSLVVTLGLGALLRLRADAGSAQVAGVAE